MTKPTPKTTKRGSMAQRRAQREAGIRKVGELLALERRTAHDLAVLLGVHQSTVFSYLHHMERVLCTARKSGELRGLRDLWELGAAPPKPAAPEPSETVTTSERRTVAAEQCGMRRDPLVAALFGPASSDPNFTSRASA